MRIFVLLLCLSACAATKIPAAGVWVDASDNTAFTFSDVNGGVRVTNAESRVDGEQYTIMRSGMSNNHFQWVVSIPSTGYSVTYRVVKQENDTLHIAWDNQFETGTCLLQREP